MNLNVLLTKAFTVCSVQKLEWIYSVMPSDGNSFCGNVVLDSFNKASWDDDKILDQIYESKYVQIIKTKILILYNILRKCILTQQKH